MRANVFLLIAGLVVTGAGASLASTNTFVVPAFRGEPATTFDGWENFTVAVGDPGNRGDLPTSAQAATLYQTAPGALVLGSGNLYNGADRSRFEIRYNAVEPVQQVVFQARTLGTELSYDSVRLFAWTQNLGTTRTELERTAFGGPPGTPGSGFSVTSEWTWDVRALNTTSFAIAFEAAELNLSLDSVTLDVQQVPEPSPVVLVALGVAALLVPRRGRVC